jgi:sn-glycerol 3-phosphate transport system substrate-binding protein
VVPSYRGSYTETMTGAIAAFRAGEQPNIVQVFEVGTGTMMAAQGAIVPVYELMANTGAEFDPSAFLPAVVGYYTDPEGNMLSMPFNSSTPILYYNKDVFEAAGLDPEQPPRTWAEVEAFSRQIIVVGCGPLRLHHRLGQLGAAGKLLGLAQPADRDPVQRLRRA